MSLPTPPEPASYSLPLPDPEAYPGEPREYARALMERKDDIEKEIAALNDVLSSHNVNSSTPLIDPEGFPRADLDIYAIRHTRSTLIRLQNDRTALISLIQTALEAAFAPGTSASGSAHRQANGTSSKSSAESNGFDHHPTTTTTTIARTEDLPDTWPEGGVARVNSVAPGSPAFESGLLAGDIIHSFSGITAASEGGLQAIGSIVQRSEGSTLTILVSRSVDGVSQRLRLRLTPRNGWGGRGMLGCHILPI